MARYLRFLRGPAGPLVGVASIGRLGYGVSTLAFIVYIQHETGSFATAGLAVAVFGIASGLLAPLRGAWVDRHGSVALLVTVVVYCLSNAAIGLAGPIAGGANYVILSGLAGASSIPFSAWTRASLARRIEGEELQSAYSVDGVLEELAFVAGPLLSGLLIGLGSSRLAIVVSLLLSLSSGLLLALAPSLRSWRPRPLSEAEERAGAVRGLLRNRALLLAVVSTVSVGATLGSFDFAVTAFAKAHGGTGQAGVVLALYSAAGVIGALIYGSRQWGLSARYRYPLLFALFGAGHALLPLAGTVGALLALTAIPGLVFTAILITNSVLINEYSHGIPGATAFSAVSSAVMLGYSLGSAIAGPVVESHGTDTAFLLAALAAALGAAPALAAAMLAREEAEPGIAGG